MNTQQKYLELKPLYARMKDGYTIKKHKFNKYLPEIKQKRIILFSDTPNEKSLMQQIKDIDDSLHQKDFKYHSGFLFTNQITPKLVDGVYYSLKKPKFICENGFYLWNQTENPEEQKRLSRKMQSFNDKMVNLSLKNAYNFDVKKFQFLMKNNRTRWSLFKRKQHEASELSKITSNVKTDSPSFIGTNTPSMGYDFHSVGHKESKKKEGKNKVSQSSLKTPQVQKRRVITEVTQEEQSGGYSKIDLKRLLNKQKDKLISIWIPPTAYPQFNGMFHYKVSRKVTICILKKYFFFRISLSKRFFLAIFEHISLNQDTWIESIELTTSKQEYVKIFEGFGWKMKCMDGMDKIRIRLNRNQL